MKWFKHECNERNEEFSSKLIDRFGLEGYARWNLLKEVVGESMDRHSDRHRISLSWSDWQSELKGKKNKLELFFKFLQEKGRISYFLDGNILTIQVPELLQKRDEYSKKSKKGKGDSQFISDSFRKQIGNVSEMNRKQNQNVSKTNSCNSLQTKDNNKNLSGQPPDNVLSKKEEDNYLRNYLKREEGENNNSPPPPLENNSTKNQNGLGDPYAGLNGHAMPVHWFLRFAEMSHKKVKGYEVSFNSQADIQRALNLVDRVADQKLLRVAWWEFLFLEKPWLQNNGKPKPRNLVIFSKFLEDCLPLAAIRMEGIRIRQKLERTTEISTPLPQNMKRNDHDCIVWQAVLEKIEKKILPENFNTWFTPIYPAGRDGPKLLIAVPNQYFERCLTENYQKQIEQTLHEVDPDIQSVEFVPGTPEEIEA